MFAKIVKEPIAFDYNERLNSKINNLKLLIQINTLFEQLEKKLDLLDNLTEEDEE